MKRFFSFVLVLLLLTPASYAVGTGDLSAMSMEELVSLRDAVNAELAARNFKVKEVTVPAGRYTVGCDIPVGVYTLSSSGDYFSSVRTYTPNGQYDMGFQVADGEPVGKLELTDGQVVEILYSSVIFKLYEGLGF